MSIHDRCKTNCGGTDCTAPTKPVKQFKPNQEFEDYVCEPLINRLKKWLAKHSG